MTAKGGDVMNRTVENFQRKKGMTNGATDSEGEDPSTPKEDRMDIDDPGSGAGRSTIGAPPELLHISLIDY